MVGRLAFEHDAVDAFGLEQVAEQQPGRPRTNYHNLRFHQRLLSIRGSGQAAGPGKLQIGTRGQLLEITNCRAVACFTRTPGVSAHLDECAAA
jgi:hypothetical protein